MNDDTGDFLMLIFCCGVFGVLVINIIILVINCLRMI